MNPFEYVETINNSKKNLIRGSDSREAAEKLYDPFLTNRALSYHPECVLIANELNKFPEIAKIQHYEFLLGMIPKGKRYSKWTKKPKKEALIESLMMFEGYSRTKAEQAALLINEEDEKELVSRMNKGGTKNDNKK